MLQKSFLLFAATLATAFIMVVDALQYGSTPTEYTAPGLFPTNAYSSYWNNPTDISTEPQPIIEDPLYVRTFFTYVCSIMTYVNQTYHW